MKLSDAIRLGARLRPTQAFWVTFERKLNATCALGAAADAVGILDTEVRNGYTGKAPEEWRPIVIQRATCPDCHEEFRQVDSCIIHLNNEEHWTRERIADWVEIYEHKAMRPRPEGEAA
jgi:hypothetical protein